VGERYSVDNIFLYNCVLCVSIPFLSFFLVTFVVNDMNAMMYDDATHNITI
jgi:hypothetical protein